MSKKSVKQEALIIPTDLYEAANFLGEISKKKREIARLQTELNEKIEALKAKAISEVQEHQLIVSHLFNGLCAFAQAHREELTRKEKRKIIDLPTGFFGWRLSRPSVSIRDTKGVLALLKKLNLRKFIRGRKVVTEETIDKEAILREEDEAKKIKGVSIIRYEEFIASPSEVEFGISKKLKKIVS